MTTNENPSTMPTANTRTGEIRYPTTWVALADEIRRLSGSEDLCHALRGDPRYWSTLESFVKVAETLASLVIEASEKEKS